LEDYKEDSKHTVAAKQMLADDLAVEPGDRIVYYFCHLCTGGSAKKQDYVVAEHLISKYELYWDMYVEELVKTLENTVEQLLDTNVRVLADPSTYDRPPVQKLKAPPKRARTGLDLFLGATKRPHETSSSSKGDDVGARKMMKGSQQMDLNGNPVVVPKVTAVAPSKKRPSKKSAFSANGKGTQMSADVVKSMFDM
jgi:hypothetical protein